MQFEKTAIAAKSVYSCFADDMSREIFNKRLLFSLTGDILNIRDLIDICSNKRCDYTKAYPTEQNHNIKELDLLCDENELVIYGAGVVGRYFYQMAQLNKRKNVLFCDRNAGNIKQCEGVEVILPQQLLIKKNANIVIAALIYLPEIKNFLLNNGVEPGRIFTIDFPVDVTKSYFDDIVCFGENEVFVDCGAFDGSTSLIFSKLIKDKYKKIFMFEPDEGNFKKFLGSNSFFTNDSRIVLSKLGIWSEKKDLCFYSAGNAGSFITEIAATQISVDSLDNILENEQVTFIKMDIEGSELEALKGAKNIIQTHKPKLAISVYHKPEDIIEIPTYIMQLVPEYKFYLRHYSFSSSETILYAVI